MGQMKVANFNVLGTDHKLWTKVKMHEPHPRCFTVPREMKSEKVHMWEEFQPTILSCKWKGQLVQTWRSKRRRDWMESREVSKEMRMNVVHDAYDLRGHEVKPNPQVMAPTVSQPLYACNLSQATLPEYVHYRKVPPRWLLTSWKHETPSRRELLGQNRARSVDR